MKKLFIILLASSSLVAGAQNAVTPAGSVALPRQNQAIPASEVQKFNKPNAFGKKDAASGWFDWADALTNGGIQLQGYRATCFPDSNINVLYADGNGGSILGEVNDHSMGLVIDPRSLLYNGSPFKISKYNTYTVDSVSIVYQYHRWNPDPDVVDSIYICLVPASQLLYYNGDKALFTAPYLASENIANVGATGKLIKYALTEADTAANFKELLVKVPGGFTVAGNSTGNNRMAVTFSFVSGRKDYVTTEPFDTLDARDFPNQQKLFNQFEYQILQDDAIFLESDTSDKVPDRIINNGLTVHTALRYNMAGSMNGSYYGHMWTRKVNGSDVEFLRMPRVLIYASSNNLGTKKITPDGYALGDAYPNPVMDGSAKVDIVLAKAEKVTLALYDLSGKKVKDIVVNTLYNSGTSTIDIPTAGLNAGIYLYSITAGHFAATGKLNIAR